MPNDLPPVLERMLDLWNGGEVDAAHVYVRGCAADGGASTFDPEEVMPTIAKFRSAFPDLLWSVEDWFAADNRYVLRMTATGTHTGEPFPSDIGTAQAGGHTIALRGIEVFEVANDRIIDVWLGWDFGALYATLGASL